MTSLSPKKHKLFFQHVKKIKPLKKTRYGYSAKRKYKRNFNGHEYSRVGQYRIRSIADQIKNRYHNNGYNALIVKSSLNYQIWVRKKDD